MYNDFSDSDIQNNIDELREDFEKVKFSGVYNKLVNTPNLPIPFQKPLEHLKLIDAENKIFREYTKTYDNTPAKNMSVAAILNYDIDEEEHHYCHGVYSRFFRPNMKSETHTIRFSVSKLVDGIFDIYIHTTEPVKGYITYSDCNVMEHGERRILATASLLHTEGKYIYSFLREDGTSLFDINNILLAGHTEGRPNFYIHILDEDRNSENRVEVVYKGITFVKNIHTLLNNELSYTIDLSNDKYLVVYKKEGETSIFKYDDVSNSAELFNIVSDIRIEELRNIFELDEIRKCL